MPVGAAAALSSAAAPPSTAAARAWPLEVRRAPSGVK